MPEPLSAPVLGKLLVALQTIDLMPDVKSMAEFVCAMLRDVPGIADAFVCLNGQVPAVEPAAMLKWDLRCAKSAEPSEASRPCSRPDHPDLEILPLHSPRREFGCLQLAIADRAQMEVYKPFLSNMGHLLATVMENRTNLDSLAESRSRLSLLVDELGDQVRERTAAVVEAEERYRTTLAGLPDGICALHALRGETGEIVDFEVTYANPANVIRHPGTELVGARLLDLHPDYRANGLFAAFCDTVKTGTPTEREVHTVHEGLPVTIEEVRASKMGDGVVWVLRDVTQRVLGIAELDRTVRVLRTLSLGSQALVRAADEATLFASVLEAIVEAGSYRVAFIAYPETGAQLASSETPVRATYGVDFDSARIQEWLRSPAVATSVDEACATGQHVVLSDDLTLSGVDAVLVIAFVVDSATTAVLGIGVCGDTAATEIFSASETRLFRDLAEDLAFGLSRLHLGTRLQNVLTETAEALGAVVEVRDPYTAGHQVQVAEIAAAIASRLGWTPSEIEGIHVAASIHDIGKTAVPSEILTKPGRLSELEMAIIRTHSQVGADIVRGIGFPWPVAEMIHQHHERLDGSGYPRGLRGSAILPGALVLAVADVVDAITHMRPYRPALGLDVAVAEISSGRGTLYDPAAVDACLDYLTVHSG